MSEEGMFLFLGVIKLDRQLQTQHALRHPRVDGSRWCLWEKYLVIGQCFLSPMGNHPHSFWPPIKYYFVKEGEIMLIVAQANSSEFVAEKTTTEDIKEKNCLD